MCIWLYAGYVDFTDCKDILYNIVFFAIRLLCFDIYDISDQPIWLQECISELKSIL